MTFQRHIQAIRQAALTLAGAIALVSAVCVPAYGERQQPLIMRGLEPEEKVGKPIDLNLEFVTESGQIVPLAKYFNRGRPVLLDLVYYRCPMLCNMVLNGQTATMRDLPWTPGNEYEIVTISIDPDEGPEQASKKKAIYMATFDRPGASGWHFLSDYRGNVKKLAEQMGFKYRWDDKTKQFVHAAVVMVLTPEGKVARYLYGTRFRAFDMRMALAEATEGRGKFSVEKILLLCYQYDPDAHSYSLAIANLMRGAALIAVIVLGFMLSRFWKWEKERAAQWKAAGYGPRATRAG